MRKTIAAAAVAGSVALAPLAGPSASAGAADHCTAWGTLPARVSLGPHGATIRTTLHGTAACTGPGLDGGATATLDAPGSRDDAPLRWTRFGDTDEVTVYASLDRPGTYRVTGGRAQVYDRDYLRVPASWQVTSTKVKYRGRFVHVSAGRSGVSATLQGYGPRGWFRHSHVRVALQRQTADGWRTIASGRSGRGGSVRLGAQLAASQKYRLVSASTRDVWSAHRTVR